MTCCACAATPVLETEPFAAGTAEKLAAVWRVLGGHASLLCEAVEFLLPGLYEAGGRLHCSWVSGPDWGSFCEKACEHCQSEGGCGWKVDRIWVLLMAAGI